MSISFFLLQLQELARAYGVQTTYYDIANKRKESSPEAILRVLQALGAPVETFDDIPSALSERRLAIWRRCLEPIVLSWDREPASVDLHLPLDQAPKLAAFHVRLENGDVQSWPCNLADIPVSQVVEVCGERYAAKRAFVPFSLPWGYHRLVMEAAEKLSEAVLVSAPSRAYPPPDSPVGRAWGAFLPLYSLHSRHSWGSGDFSDLEALITWVSELGGSMVATLPLLASSFDEASGQSPYAPVSRLFWNEFYVDITKASELQSCDMAQAVIQSTSFTEELEVLRSLPLVDYGRQMTLKRRVLDELARCFYRNGGDRFADFCSFMESNRRLDDYACFRAAWERRGDPWWEWPQPLRDGALSHEDYDEDTKRYYAYVQWLAHEQLHRVSERAREKNSGLYIDLPLGVRADGYDVWRERDLFVMGASAGAPPDTLYSAGQNWRFPPLHPERIREQGYRYVIDYLDNHMQHAGFLRIDHVMSLHRLFWIPEGMEPTDGVYVLYPANELCAIVNLESHRHKCRIVGENLGTVPPCVNEMLVRHNMHGMYVVQYELPPDAHGSLPAPSANDVGSLNTHDMPPFLAFWQGLDIKDRLSLGLLNEESARTEWEGRQAVERALVHLLRVNGWLEDGQTDDIYAVMMSCLKSLAASAAKVVLVNLEDLWLETEPQNRPGTRGEYPNWRRRARHGFEVFSGMPEVRDALVDIDFLVKG